MRTALGLTLLVLTAPVRAEAPRDKSVPILFIPFDNATGEKELTALEKGLPDLITACLSFADAKISVLDRSLLDALAGEKALDFARLLRPETAARAPQLAQARYLVRGSFTARGDTLRVQVFLHETETTRLVRALESAGPRSRPVEIAEQLAGQIAAHFSAPFTALPDLPRDPDPQTALGLIHGLGAYHHGQYPQALAAFLNVLRETPQNPTAQFWLAKSFEQSGLNANAAQAYREFIDGFPRHPRAAEAAASLRTLEARLKSH